jgi:hypothetical protein
MIKSKDVPHTQVAAVVQDVMVDYLTKKGYYPATARFENIVAEGQKIVLKDLKHKVMVVVTLGNRGPYCEYDKSLDCDHIKFVKVMPYVKAQKKRLSHNTHKPKA